MICTPASVSASSPIHSRTSLQAATSPVFAFWNSAAASRFISAVTKGICACAYLYNAQSLKLTGSLTAGYVGLIVLCGVAALLVFLIKPVVKPQN